MLHIDGLGRRFGGIRALHEVSFDVPRGTICALIGPNGAGKTTLINIASGLLRPSSGRVVLDGTDLGGAPPHRIAKAGAARTFQNIRLFGDLSVLDNILVGRHLHRRDTLFEALFSLPRSREADRRSRAAAMELLARLGIEHLAPVPASTLSYGDQRRVELARALALEPKLLLLDEPAAGMNAAETQRLADQLRELRDGGLTLLVVEHDMELVMRISDQVVVLNFGMLVAVGTPDEVRRNPDVIAAYLGDDADEVDVGIRP
jgi:ABC-type branched-subunit amino acid transport system ATPase component